MRFAITVFFLALFFVSNPVLANDFEKRAQQHVQNLGDKAIEAIVESQNDPQERRQDFRRLLDNYFHVPTIARFAMGRYWADASQEQRDDYLDLFKTMVVEIYAQRFDDYGDQTLAVSGARTAGSGDVLVEAEIVFSDESKNIPLKWRVREFNGQPLIIDLVVEGVSMSVTQRSDFNSVLQNNNGDVSTLIAMLDEKYNGASE